MAKLTNAVTSYNSKAATGGSEHPEDVSDIIYNIDPSDTPLVSVCGSRNISNTLFEWIVEGLSARSSTTILEGNVITPEASVMTERKNNICQIQQRSASVSRTQQVLKNFGKASQLGHQMARKGKELKRDVEFSITRNQARNLGNDTTARTTAGILSWLKTNISFLATHGSTPGANPTGDGSDTRTRDAGSGRALTQDLINDVMELAFTNGGEPTEMFLSPKNQSVLSGLQGRTNTRYMVDTGTVGEGAVTVFSSDFGDIKCTATRTLADGAAADSDTDVFILDPEHIKLAYLRNYESQTLGITSDGIAKSITVEYGLQIDNEKAHGLITDLAVS